MHKSFCWQIICAQDQKSHGALQRRYATDKTHPCNLEALLLDVIVVLWISVKVTNMGVSCFFHNVHSWTPDTWVLGWVNFTLPKYSGFWVWPTPFLMVVWLSHGRTWSSFSDWRKGRNWLPLVKWEIIHFLVLVLVDGWLDRVAQFSQFQSMLLST